MFSQNNKEDHLPLNTCLACGGTELIPVLNLGNQPLANSLLSSDEETSEVYPLGIGRCSNCFHVQLTHIVNPDLMFKNYLYVSGTSQTMLDHFAWFAKYTFEYFNVLSALKPSKVLDIGCNDGSQLNHYKNLGMKTFGIDPASNLLQFSAKKHIVFPEYFDMKFAMSNSGTYDILTAQNVFAHNYNPLGFLEAAKELMSSDSLLFIQTSQSEMILNNEFDTIYHEHISFFNIRSMRKLCERAGLYLIDVTKCPLHGTSYIFVISKNKSVSRTFNIENLENMEKNKGLYTASTYEKYKREVEVIALDFQLTIKSLKSSGYKIVGYGAAAKGMTFLNYTGMNNTIFDSILDDNPLKVDKFTPGTFIPIKDPSVLFKEETEKIAFVPLAWNFYSEIRSRIKTKRLNGKDVFVKYFPGVDVQP